MDTFPKHDRFIRALTAHGQAPSMLPRRQLSGVAHGSRNRLSQTAYFMFAPNLPPLISTAPLTGTSTMVFLRRKHIDKTRFGMYAVHVSEYFDMRWFCDVGFWRSGKGIPYDIAAPPGMIGASQFFRLAIAVAT